MKIENYRFRNELNSKIFYHSHIKCVDQHCVEINFSNEKHEAHVEKLVPLDVTRSINKEFAIVNIWIGVSRLIENNNM